jgi:hypothetical protein
MIRQTHDMSKYPYQCCTKTGLNGDAPEVVWRERMKYGQINIYHQSRTCVNIETTLLHVMHRPQLTFACSSGLAGMQMPRINCHNQQQY